MKKILTIRKTISSNELSIDYFSVITKSHYYATKGLLLLQVREGILIFVSFHEGTRLVESMHGTLQNLKRNFLSDGP
jgi:hypothetical protein